MARRRTIGENPLDALVPSSRQVARPRDIATRRRTAQPPAAPAVVKATFNLPAALVDEAKNAVVTLGGAPVRLTLAALVSGALTRELERLKKAHHGGKPWPPRSAPLVGGRPLKA
jgi:hypothetical protein